MADLTALNAAVATLTTEVAAVDTAVKDLVAAQGANDQAGVDAAVAAITAANATLQGDAASDPGAPAAPAAPVVDPAAPNG